MEPPNEDLDKSLIIDTNEQFEAFTPVKTDVKQGPSDPLGDEVNDADTAVLYIFATLKQGFGLR